MNRRVAKWSITKRDTFIQSVRDLNKPLRRRLGTIIDQLIYSDFPNRLGDKKITKYGEAFTINLDRSRRILYEVDFINRAITLVRVGDHKESYGKDKKS